MVDKKNSKARNIITAQDGSITYDPPVEFPKGKSVFNPKTGEVKPYKENK